MQFEFLYLIFAAVLCMYSWYLHVKSKTHFAIAILVLSGLLLRLYMASDNYLHAWDERYHALVAKNMMDFPWTPMLYKNPVIELNSLDWAHGHIWLHKQPLPMWSMALSMKLFGCTEFAIRLPAILLSTAGIWFTYNLGKRLYNQSVGFFAAFLFAIQGLILEIGSGRVATDHIDLFFLCLILIAVWAAKVYSDSGKILFNIICGIAIGAAVLTKWLPALIVLPIWGLFQVSQNGWNFKRIVPRLLILCGVIGIVAIPWQIYIRSSFPLEYAYESSFNIRHITETLDGRGAPFYYHFDKMRMVYGELVYLPLLWFIYSAFKKRKINDIALLIWLIIPYVFFSIAKTKMQGYTLFTAPALLIICGLFWNELKLFWKEKKNYRVLIGVVMAALILLPVRYSIERVKPFDTLDKSPEWVSDLKRFNEQLNKERKSILFNVNNPIEAMFYTDVEAAYEFIPGEEKLDSLKQAGFDIYINSNVKQGPIRNYQRVYLTQPNYE